MKKLKLKKQEIKSNHPEAKEGEIYIGNATNDTYKSIAWETKRKGKTPIWIITEEALKVKGLFPVFVQQSEMQEYKESKFIKEK